MRIYCEGCNGNKFEVFMRKKEMVVRCGNSKCDTKEEIKMSTGYEDDETS